MGRIKIDVPYFVWRDGRPRWVPGPKLRARGWKGRDLKDEAGQFLPLQAALAAARDLNREVLAAGEAKAPRTQGPRRRTVRDLVEAYFRSEDFSRKAPATQSDYKKKADAVFYKPRPRAEAAKARQDRAPREPELFAKAPALALGKPEVKAFFETLVRRRGLAMARGAIMVLSAAYTWAATSTEWRARENPCHRLDLPSPPARLRVGTEAEIRALVAAADVLELASVGDAVYLGLFTGQRETDVLALVDPFGSNMSLAQRAAAGEAVRFRQSKTGARVAVFPAPQLVARLAAADARKRTLKVVPEAIVVAEAFGDVYPTGDHFRRRFQTVRELAVAGDQARGLEPCPSLADFTFRDLRDTAVTWLARAGATVPEIAAVTGHSLKGIYTILKHYLELDEPMARAAIAKLVTWIEAQGMEL